MKNGYVKSSPRFFSMILRSMAAMILLLLMLAAFIPAPLQTAADPAMTPNPVKSAWFLLWIQELVSWSRHMIWAVIIAAVLFLLLPWLSSAPRQHHAVWFPGGQRRVTLLTLTTFLAILLLTMLAMFLRGENWSLHF